MRNHRNPDDTLRWVRRGSAAAVLVVGWTFILVINHFHITPPVVFVCLGYFAAIAAIYTLYRTGATAVAATDDTDDVSSWGRPIGELSELEREKRTLLKAIKEAEFDHQMGKLSKADADAMIAVYRARAIEVIKEIDVQNSTSGKLGSVRDQILREARARIHVEEKASDVATKPAKKGKSKGNDKDKQKARTDKLADAVDAAKGAVAKTVEAETGKKVVDADADADGKAYAIVDTGTNADGTPAAPDAQAKTTDEAKPESKTSDPEPETAESKEAAR